MHPISAEQDCACALKSLDDDYIYMTVFVISSPFHVFNKHGQSNAVGVCVFIWIHWRANVKYELASNVCHFQSIMNKENVPNVHP